MWFNQKYKIIENSPVSLDMRKLSTIYKFFIISLVLGRDVNMGWNLQVNSIYHGFGLSWNFF